jgi:two-component system OmpR family sensor kinase
MAGRTPHSLRARLQGFLLLAILLTALVQAVIAYRTARAEADGIFDYHMQQMAQSLRHGLPLSAPAPELGSAGAEPGIDFVVQVWAFDGARIFQSEIRNELPDRALLGFSNVRAGGTTYRVFSMETRDHVIQVAQDMAIRDAMASGFALRSVLPVVVMAPLLMLIAWWVVRTSLAPVNRVRHQVAARRADDLAEVSEAGLPEEVRPLVQELNLLFQRVRRAFDAQQSFVADAAHELRSPLAALKLQAEGLRRAADEAERERAVVRLSAGIDRAARLVDQLLALARQQASEASGIGARPVRLDEVARQAVADAAASAHEHGIDLGLSEAQEVRIDGHAEALAILLRNLVDNAIKYTPPGGRIDVAVRRHDGVAVLSVDDSGPGIPPEDRERVMDRFYRVAGTQTPGSGLGLAIVQSIADAHHAKLSLDRSAELGGLRVQLEFPASAGAASE